MFKAKKQVIQSPSQTSDRVWKKTVAGTNLCCLLDSLKHKMDRMWGALSKAWLHTIIPWLPTYINNIPWLFQGFQDFPDHWSACRYLPHIDLSSVEAKKYNITCSLSCFTIQWVFLRSCQNFQTGLNLEMTGRRGWNENLNAQSFKKFLNWTYSWTCKNKIGFRSPNI